MSGGSASPAETQQRSFSSSRCGRVGAREERGIEGRHRVEHRDRMLAQDRGDAVGRRPVRQQHRGGADRQREGQRVAEPVGEEQLRHREADVVLGDAEHGAAVEIGGEPQIGVHMHRALRLAGRARGVEPEAMSSRVVGAVTVRGSALASSILEILAMAAARCSPATITCMRSGHRADQLGEFRQQRLRHHQHLARGCRRA